MKLKKRWNVQHIIVCLYICMYVLLKRYMCQLCQYKNISTAPNHRTFAYSVNWMKVKLYDSVKKKEKNRLFGFHFTYTNHL